MANYVLDILVKATDQASGPLGNIGKSLGGLGSAAQQGFGGLQKAVGTGLVAGLGALTVGVGALGAGLASAVSAGSDVEEMMGKFSVVFANTQQGVIEQLDAFGRAVGRNKYELRDMAATFGDTLKPMGFAEQDAADLAVQMSKLAVDLGSFNNMKTDEALRRLQGTLIGSHENALAFGVVINENTLKAEMAANGWDELTGAQLEQAKVQARINLLMKGTTDAQGDAARTSGGWANQMRRLQSILQETQAEIGTKLLPVLTPFLSKLGDLAGKILPVVIDIVEDFFDGLAKGKGIIYAVQSMLVNSFDGASWIGGMLQATDLLQDFFDGLGKGEGVIYAIQSALINSFDGAPWIDGMLTATEFLRNLLTTVSDAITQFVSWKDVLIATGVVVASIVVPFLVGLATAAAPVIAVAAALVGAVALLRNAWESDWGGIQALVGGVVESITTAYQGFIDGTLTLPEAIGQAFSGIGAAVSAQLPGWIATLQGWATAAWQWIVEAIPVVLSKLGEWYEGIRAYILTNRVGWKIALEEWATDAWQWIVDAIPLTLGKLGEWVASLIGGLAAGLPDFLAMLYEWAAGIVDWIGEAIPRAIDNLTRFIESLGSEGDGTGESTFVPMVARWVGLLIDWVVNDLVPKVGPAFLSFSLALLEAFGQIGLALGRLALTIGNTVLEQLLAGMKAGWDAVLAWFGTLRLPNLNPFSGGTAPGYATGTAYAGGGWSMVGEAGPELVRLPRGASVATANETRNMLGGASQGPTYNISIHVPAGATQTDGQNAARGFLAEMRAAGLR